MMSLSTMNHWKSWSKNLMQEEPMLPSEYLTTYQLGAQQFTVAAYLCNQLLWYRIYGTGCRAL